MTLEFAKQNDSEFSGVSFCLIYTGLDNREASTQKYHTAQAKKEKEKITENQPQEKLALSSGRTVKGVASESKNKTFFLLELPSSSRRP